VEQALASIVAEFGLQPATTVAYLCGNPDMVERSREVLLAAGLPADAIVHENYWVSEGHAA
jgi:NAD(P)H-flavin reductase